MGTGTWTSADYASYSSRTAYTAKPLSQVFVNNSVKKDFNPALISLRESCDSPDNPISTPIIFGLDVTGSMGAYAGAIAKEALPELMTAIMEQMPVTNPHLMFMGIDDAHAGSPGPLQVSQFEADLRILEQLRELWLVGRGGGNQSEGYDLPWYFAAHRTATDSFDKRGSKGFIFTMGDEEAPYETMTADLLEQVFGPGQYQDMTPAQILAEAQEKYHVFHIVIEQGNYCRQRLKQVRSSWTELLGNNALFLSDFQNLSELVVNTLKIVRGADIEEVLSESRDQQAMRYAFHNAQVENS